MQLREVLTKDAAFDPRFAAREVTGISANSRAVKPGDIFVALSGNRTDGTRFIADAVQAGAVAIVAERLPALPPDVIFVRVTNARRALSLMAARFFPRQPETIAAVTGTSGKTSIVAFLRQ
ncbi:MAG: Mur ligase domain-containing protein, partial [Variibacter sp.]